MDRGNYTCNVENSHGKDEITYNVYVRGMIFLCSLKIILITDSVLHVK